MPHLLALNCGSSSIKGKLFALPALKEAATLAVSNIGSKGDKVTVTIRWTGGEGEDVDTQAGAGEEFERESSAERSEAWEWEWEWEERGIEGGRVGKWQATATRWQHPRPQKAPTHSHARLAPVLPR